MDNQFQKDTTATGETTQTAFIDEQTRKEYFEKLRQEQNLSLGLIGGLGAALVCALIWVVITVWTGYQISYMPIGIGIAVGFAIRFLGKGIDIIYGILGAVLSLFGCLLGDFLSIYGFLANAYNMSYFEIFGQLDLSMAIDTFVENTDFMSVLFYGVAIFVGFTSAKESPSDEDILAYAVEKQNA